MKKVKKFWVEFLAPGSIVSNTWTKGLDSIPNPVDIEFPESAYAFTLNMREDIVDGDNDTQALQARLARHIITQTARLRHWKK
jgi:hypothetical protein